MRIGENSRYSGKAYTAVIIDYDQAGLGVSIGLCPCFQHVNGIIELLRFSGCGMMNGVAWHVSRLACAARTYKTEMACSALPPCP